MVSVAMLAAAADWEVGMIEWLLTYAVHSTALIGAIWIVTSLVPKIPLSIKETMWKVALVGGLFTASVHGLAGVAPPWGQLELPPALAGQRVQAPSSDAVVAEATEPAVERRVVVHRNGDLQIRATAERRPAATAAAVAAPSTPQPTAPGPWRWVLLGLVTAGSLFASLRLALAARRLRAQLRARRDVIEDPVLEAFLGLCSKAELKKRPRLTASAHLRSPIALPSHEICLPERAVDSLTPAQQHGMLAHELAHLIRKDPWWQVLAATIEAVFFFQPLNHLARKKMQEVAEYQCDDWAARNTGTGVHLAKCLAEVASWVENGPASNPLATLMAHESSPIVRRITRLLDDAKREGAAHPIARVGVTVGTLGLATWLVPGVAQAQAQAAPAMTSASPAPGDRNLEIAFADVDGGEHARSRVVLQSGDEVVELEVDHPRAVPAPPEPPPVPEPRSRGLSIVIEGGGWGDPWFGMFGGQFHGYIGIDVDGGDDLQYLLSPGFPFGADDLDFDDLGDALESQLRHELFGGGTWHDHAEHHGRHERDRAHDSRWHHRGGEAAQRDHDGADRYRLLGDDAPTAPSGIVEL